MWFDLSRQGQKFKALSKNCQMMVFDERPYCIAADVFDLTPDFFRMDFVYKQYDAENVAKIATKLRHFTDVTNCMKGNFENNNI